MKRGDIWWAELPEPVGSGPGFRRPVLVVQSESFNQSRIRTVIIAIITKNVDLASAMGNVLIPSSVSGLRTDSVINVSQVFTVDRSLLTEFVGQLPPA